MDLYSKIILTIIAAALCGLIVQNSGVLPAYAQRNSSQVQLCGFDNYNNLNCLGVFGASGSSSPTMKGWIEVK